MGPKENSLLEFVEKGFDPTQAAAFVFDPKRLNEVPRILDTLTAHPQGKAVVTLHLDGTIKLISAREILYFHADGNNVHAYTKEIVGEVKGRLYELEEKLPSSRFVRISKSAIVNLGAITEVRPWFGRNILLRFGIENRQVEVSRLFVSALRARLGL